jgi:hypothetical protein
MAESPTGAQRRAAVVSRHPATLRQLAQSLGVAGLSMRQAIGPSFLPRSARGEFEVVVLDLDIDAEAPPPSLVEAVSAACPDTPVVTIAGLNTRHRLVQSLAAPAVMGIAPKLGTWLEAVSGTQPAAEGADEQELGVAIKRLINPASIPQGPIPYLLGGTPIEERLVGSSGEKESVLADVMHFAGRFGLSDEKLRRIEVITDELLMNGIYDAPVDDQGKQKYAALDRRTPVSLGAQAQVRLRFGSDGRTFVASVSDRFGSLSRATVAAHIARVLEARGPRPRAGSTGGAGLGLVLCFTSSNQLIIHGNQGRFSEVTSVVHIAGSNRAAMARGSALYMYL